MNTLTVDAYCKLHPARRAAVDEWLEGVGLPVNRTVSVRLRWSFFRGDEMVVTMLEQNDLGRPFLRDGDVATTTATVPAHGWPL